MTTNPTVIKFCNEQVRPDAERIRAAYARGVDFTARLSGVVVPILVAEGLVTVDGQTGAITPVSGQEATIIDDGRANEGVHQLTIAEFCKLANTFGGLTQTIAGDQEFITSLSKACVRPLEALR